MSPVTVGAPPRLGLRRPAPARAGGGGCAGVRAARGEPPPAPPPCPLAHPRGDADPRGASARSPQPPMHPGGPEVGRRRESCAAWSCPPHRSVGGHGRPGTPPPRPSLEPTTHPLVAGRTLPPPPVVGGGGRRRESRPAWSCPPHPAPNPPTTHRPDTPRPPRPGRAAPAHRGHTPPAHHKRERTDRDAAEGEKGAARTGGEPTERGQPERGGQPREAGQPREGTPKGGARGRWRVRRLGHQYRREWRGRSSAGNPRDSAVRERRSPPGCWRTGNGARDRTENRIQ